MAVKAHMRPALELIAREIAAYTKEQGLKRSEFSLSGAWQERTDRVSLVLNTTKSAPWFSWYRDIIRRLQSTFEKAGAPEATWNVGLVVQTDRDQGELHSGFRLADGEEDVTDYLEAIIEKEWPNLEPSHTAIIVPD